MSPLPDLAPAPGADVLASMVAARREAERAEREVLRHVVAYAAAHPAPGLSEPGVFGHEQVVELAGAGAPGIGEFAVADIAAALGLSTMSARRLIGQTLELRHRLPRLWALIATEPTGDRAGAPAWRARMVAERTVALSEAGAAYVDAQVAPALGKVGPVRLARIVEAARVLSEEPEHDELIEQSGVHAVTVDTRSSAHLGTAYVDGHLAAADGLDLEAAVQVAAAHLKEQARAQDRPVEPLQVRRAQALGVIARHYLATAPAGGAARSDGVHLVVHYRPGSDAAGLGLAELGNTNGLVSTDQIAAWCAREGASVKILPVVDLAEDLCSGGYVPSPYLRRQVELRDTTCVFPHCTARAAQADLDHIVAYDPGGQPSQTRSSNLGALCRFHHRLKTHGEWTYSQLAPGWYHWRAPGGGHYLRGPTVAIQLRIGQPHSASRNC